MTTADFDILWQQVSTQFQCGSDSIHGPSHWRRVEQHGLSLATKTGADITVVRLFALFHDAQRVNESVDHGHGVRGAELAAKMRGSVFAISEAAFTVLHAACSGHTDNQYSTDPTIGTCWDADRLDLGRVGIIPDERFMSTAFGKEIARNGGRA
jgi:uncharacterized protein